MEVLPAGFPPFPAGGRGYNDVARRSKMREDVANDFDRKVLHIMYIQENEKI